MYKEIIFMIIKKKFLPQNFSKVDGKKKTGGNKKVNSKVKDNIKTEKAVKEEKKNLPVIGSKPSAFNQDDMRGLFFITKGKYEKGIEPAFIKEVNGEVSYVGGYNPDRDDTEEWYMCLDRVTYNCTSCGSDYDKVLNSVRNMILKFEGKAEKYFKFVSNTTTEDYYFTHYLNHRPFSQEELNKRLENGKSARVSPIMKNLYNAVYEYYGDYYVEDIEEVEEKAYKELKEESTNKHLKKALKRLRKSI